MQSNPVVWKIFGLTISLVGGRCLAAAVLMADVAFVLWGYFENNGLSKSVRRARLYSAAVAIFRAR
jgi:hypothetical protein